jgi:hypothetical protein
MLKKYICIIYMNINRNHKFNMNEVLPNSNINRNKYHSTNFNDINNTKNTAFFCNTKKQNQFNQDIFDRSIFCNGNIPNELIMERPEIKQCDGINKEMRTKGQPSGIFNPELPDCCDINHCIGDKGDPLKYFSTIDIESHIMNIDTKLNNCRTIEYKREFDDDSCVKLCCNPAERNVNLQEVSYKNPNKCVNPIKPKKCDSSIDYPRPRPFDTLYDYTNSNDCRTCEPVWNKRSKRRYLDPIECAKSKYQPPSKECPNPCLGNFPDISELLKDNRNKEFDFCPTIN